MSERYDVVIVGCGPCGLASAALLGARGLSVLVLEKHPERYSLPRAGHLDHEALRIVQAVGAHTAILEDEAHHESYEWFSAGGETLLSLPWHTPTASGFSSDFMMYQPVLEEALHESVVRSPRASVRLGAMVIGLRQDAASVELDVQPMGRGADGAAVPEGEPYQVTARYVIAADGAGSPTRDGVLRIPRTDYGFNEQWLDVDCRIKRPLPEGIDGLWCDPARPTLICSLGRRHHRFECALLPGEAAEDVLDQAFIWQWLGKHGVTHEHVEPIRQTVYTFEARIAERWRDRRVLLIGDAAHTMPPHMGQGLCSGLRDAANLAWKLDLVLRDRAGDGLLDTYEIERRPHVKQWMDISIAIGQVSQVLDPVLAAERDAKMLAGYVPPMPPFPSLTHGVVQVGRDGEPQPPAGSLFQQEQVESADGNGLLHDVVGHGFLVVSADRDPRDVLDDEAMAVLEALDARIVWIGDPTGGGLADPTGRISEFFQASGTAAAIVRPDYYVAAAVTDLGDLSSRVHELGRQLRLDMATSF